MNADRERLEAALTELRNERGGVESTMTREDLARNVEQWLATARAHAAGSSRLALGGQASGEHWEAVLAEDLLADDGLAGRIVARLERQGFGEFSDRQKGSKFHRARPRARLASRRGAVPGAGRAGAPSVSRRARAGRVGGLVVPPPRGEPVVLC